MDAQTLILGGGPAGTAAAIALARRGHKVVLVDRETASRHKVCGEFLSAEALHLLAALGVKPGTSNGASGTEAQPIRNVRLVSSRHVTERALPFPALSLTRRCMDIQMLQAAEAAGVCVVRGSVERLAPQGDGWKALLVGGQELFGARVILATGKHDLRGFPRPRGRQNDLVALKMYFRLRPEENAALANAVELHLFPGGYAGLQLVEDGAANLTALIQKVRLAQMGGWPGLLGVLRHSNSVTARRLEGAEPLLEKPLALSGIPYGFVRRRALAPGMYAVGDQAAVIPSFTGDGMSIALFSGLMAARAIVAEQAPSLFQRELHGLLATQVRRATVLSRALVHPLAKPLLVAAAHHWPGGLQWAAGATRLSAAAMAAVE